jgi:hypothetical protein
VIEAAVLLHDEDQVVELEDPTALGGRPRMQRREGVSATWIEIASAIEKMSITDASALVRPGIQMVPGA